jgi:divalent metal cation (Fe/Co/Zn/Cd) transporter
MRKQINKVMENLKNKSLKVVRVDKTEFELDNGDVYPIPFELDVDEDISIEEFQKILDSSKETILKILDKTNE